MIRVTPQLEPEGFDEHVRKKGAEWLEASVVNPTKERPIAYWTQWEPCAPAVAQMFAERCGYLATVLTPGCGHVDHFVSWKSCKEQNKHHLAYEWTNYRWLHPQLNSSKQGVELVDPFEVEDEWFDLEIFTLNLVVHWDKIQDAAVRGRVKATVERLGLIDGARAIKLREGALQLYQKGLRIEAVEGLAPLVGRALRRLIDAGPDQPNAAHARLRARLLAAHRAATAP